MDYARHKEASDPYKAPGRYTTLVRAKAPWVKDEEMEKLKPREEENLNYFYGNFYYVIAKTVLNFWFSMANTKSSRATTQKKVRLIVLLRILPRVQIVIYGPTSDELDKHKKYYNPRSPIVVGCLFFSRDNEISRKENSARRIVETSN